MFTSGASGRTDGSIRLKLIHRKVLQYIVYEFPSRIYTIVVSVRVELQFIHIGLTQFYKWIYRWRIFTHSVHIDISANNFFWSTNGTSKWDIDRKTFLLCCSVVNSLETGEFSVWLFDSWNRLLYVWNSVRKMDRYELNYLAWISPFPMIRYWNPGMTKIYRGWMDCANKTCSKYDETEWYALHWCLRRLF
jgi:hypothetical protein